MPTNENPESRLDRVARDLSRTLLHGARPGDVTGVMRPSTVLTGQQIRVDLPAGDLNFLFSAGAGASQNPLKVNHSQAADTDQLMADALGKDAAKYLSLNLDPTIPIWVFQQRQFTITNPPVMAESISTGGFTVAKLSSTVLQEVGNESGDSYVSLYFIDPATKKSNLIPAANWQPAIFLRFPLQIISRPTGVPEGTQVYGLVGVSEGDRWYLDKLGLLPGSDSGTGPDIADISFTLEKNDGKGNVTRPPTITEWSIARTNLTQEARPAKIFERAMAATAQPAQFPYIVLSGDSGANEDALRLLDMASITNSGGYYFSATTAMADATSLILAVRLKPEADPDTSNTESARLFLAANAIALTEGTAADFVRFNGIEEIEITPFGPTGTVSFGWTRSVPSTPATPEDKFGYGTLSIVDYSATDGSDQAVPMPGVAPVISPMKPLQADHYQRLGSQTAIASERQSAQADAPRTAAVRLPAAQPTIHPFATTDDDTMETHCYRGSIVCYDKQTESPWQRLRDESRRQISVTAGFRDVFGNRFDAVSAPAFQYRLAYTDPIINPADWPGLRFAMYPETVNGQPVLAVELIYDKNGFDDKRALRLREIRDQLQGVADDVTVTFQAEPLLSGPQTLDIRQLILQLNNWANGVNDQLVLPLGSFTCDGKVVDLVRFAPTIQIKRKPDYLPADVEFPKDPVLATLIRNQLTSAETAITMQVNAAPTAPKPDDPERQDESREIAQQFQLVIATALNVQVGFLRDRLNQHEIWLIPNSLFPSVPQGDASTYWSFATPCPLRNTLGNDTSPAPDFTQTTTTDPMWKKYGFPLVSQAVVDQDVDELGRVAFRMLEAETAELGSLIPRSNAVTMRSLLRSRENIANQLATFNSTGNAPGFIVPLLDKTLPGNLDPAAITRIAKDAFLRNLNSFYAVSTIVQLPLDKPGDPKIQTFQGEVMSDAMFGEIPATQRPSFSDVLLGGGDPKVTVLYDLPPQITNPTQQVPALPSLVVNILHIQMRQTGMTSGANPFNEGPWIELAEAVVLTWKGFPQTIPVAARVFPPKPIIQSAETTLPALNSAGSGTTQQKIDGSSAPLLAMWGWKFSFSLVNGLPGDTAHVTVRYPKPRLTAARLRARVIPLDWSPVSLLNALVTIKLLGDNQDSPAFKNNQLNVLDDLAQSLLSYLGTGPELDLAPGVPSGVNNDASDTFTVGFQGDLADKSLQVMKGSIDVNWSTRSAGVTRVDTAVLDAPGETAGNNACLTGANPVRSYKLSLILKRNEFFVGQPANPLLVYQCAPVQPPADCLPLNQWPPLLFDMSGQTLESALQVFFDGIFHQADLSQLSVEVGSSLVWSKGSMSAVTPFSILPGDIKPAGGIAAFVAEKCQELLGTLIQPGETDAASLRLRVKVTAVDKDTPSGSRTLVNIPSIDFSLSAPNTPEPSGTSKASFSKQIQNETGVRGLRAKLSDLWIGVSQNLLQSVPTLYPQGVSEIELTVKLEPKATNFSLRIVEAKQQQELRMPPQNTTILADNILNYCIALKAGNDPVMGDCNAFVKKVGAQFGVPIPNLDADGIVGSFNSAPFTKTTMDPAIAMQWANDGLVVAGMTKSDLNPTYGTQYQNGHVAIVHASEDPAHPGYPMASWGVLNHPELGHANASIRLSFPASACNDNAVRFAFAPTSS